MDCSLWLHVALHVECCFLLSGVLETDPQSSLGAAAAAAAKSLQLFPTLCDPIDSSPPGSPVPGILQARTLEWVAISFSKAWKWKVKGELLGHVWLLATPWTAANQAPLSMGFSRQEYWSGVPLPSPSLGAGSQHLALSSMETVTCLQPYASRATVSGLWIWKDTWALSCSLRAESLEGKAEREN